VTTLLVLASAALHALWNALLKRERDKDAAVVAVLAVAAALAALAATVEGAAAARVPFGDRAALGWSAAAGLFEAGYFITLAMALERAPLGLAYTVSRGAAILAVWPVSAFWLGEPVSAPALAGSAVLLAGLLVAGLQRGAGRAGVALACLCAGFIAGYHLCYKRAMAGEPSAPAVFAVALAVALPVSLARLGPRRVAVTAALVRRPGPLLAAGGACAASFLLLLLALREGGAGLVLTLRNSSILFALLFARLLGERSGPRQLAGALLVAIGAALLGARR
jgi:drug/metabolite transporter (DMT)-like permease